MGTYPPLTAYSAHPNYASFYASGAPGTRRAAGHKAVTQAGHARPHRPHEATAGHAGLCGSPHGEDSVDGDSRLSDSGEYDTTLLISWEPCMRSLNALLSHDVAVHAA